MKKEDFYVKLEKKGLILSSKQKENLQKYYLLLCEYNKVMNLTGIVEEEEVYEKHFYDCLLFSFKYSLDNKYGIDVGSGAGFPGLVLAICYPKLTIDLLEPLNKRCSFLNKVIEELQLTNVKVINERSEIYCIKNEEKYDFATARAVAKLNILLEISAKMIKIDGYFIALKGKIAKEEILEAKDAIDILGFNLDFVQETKLPSFEDDRTNIFLKKIKKTHSKYPRNYGQIKKHPL
ncbi:MAG: 16S rRNA (guanine(527)-N(7))-methyltransferase RsmG [Bacilli bacterium]